MQNSRTLAIKLGFLSALAVLSVQAQTAQRCDLADKDTTLNGQPGKQCLDVSSLKGQTIGVPSNVTRIDNQGLALCTKSVTTGGDADFIFAMDQSGSMGLSFIYVNPNPPHDTIYYSDPEGCPVGTTSPPAIGKPPGANIYTNPVTIQTAVGPVIVWSIKNNAGCASFSGDPFKVRASVVSKAIDAIANASTNSTIGYAPFAHDIWTPANCQRPLRLTAANIATLKSKIIIDSSYGTNYNRPLDSAKQWLNAPLNLGRNTKRAIVFISDGTPQPPDSNGFAKIINSSNYNYLDKTIPIYGIFLGVAGEAATLQAICDTTRPLQVGGGPGVRVPLGSDFFRVSPSRPDSITTIMKNILNKIITSYTPTLFTVTNTSLAPQVTSRAATVAPVTGQFTDQGGGNFRIVLDSALPLQTGANSIRIISQLTSLPTTPPTPVINQGDTANFVLNVGAGTASSFLGGLVTKCYNPTTLQWLDTTGLRPSSGYFTDSNTRVQVLVTTSKNGLATIVPTLKTTVPPPPIDSLKPNLPRSADSLHYSALIPIAAPYGTAVPNAATLENKISDTLRAFWKNPRDPRDTAGDIIPIHPTNKQATAYFSNDSLGTTNISQFPIGVTQAYVIIKDQRGDPAHFAYQITITLRSGDREVYPLTQSTATPGLFYAKLTLVQNGIPLGNGILQYSSLGDQMFGTYSDPINLDQATCQAGIGQPPQFSPYIQFTDATGAVLPTGTVIPNTKFWSLVNTGLYLTVTDFNKTFTSVPVQVTARSLKLGQVVSQDSESMVQGAKHVINGDLADWRDNIPLSEAFSPLPVNGDGKLQGSYRIVITATAHPHDSTGVELTGQTMSDSVVVAYPDSSGYLGFTDAVNPADSTGPSSLIDTLKDQNFVRTSNTDVVTATAFCYGSTADSVHLNFTQVPSGAYISNVLVRDTLTPNTGDAKLSCPADSGVLISYTDPVYLTKSNQIILQTHTPKASPADTFFASGLNITLQTTTEGALIDYRLDPYSAPVPLIGPAQQYTGQISIVTTVNLKAVASKPGYLRSRVISSNYLLQPKVLAGYMMDNDRDGRADRMQIIFERAVISIPSIIDSVYWNKEAVGYVGAMYNAKLTADSLLLTADAVVPFPWGRTGIFDSTKGPVAKFPLGGYFNGLRVHLIDLVGPVPVNAEKRPSDLKVDHIDASGQKILDPDTLLITTSEPINDVDQFGIQHLDTTLFRFRSGVSNCLIPTSSPGTDTGTHIVVQNISHVKDSLTSDGLVSIYRLIVDNRGSSKTPQIGDCIYLDFFSQNFTDFNNNLPGLAGVALGGGNSKRSIQGLDGYPPVSGLAPGSKAFNIANSSDPASNKLTTDVSGTVQWVAPKDFPTTYVDGTPYTPTATHVITDTTVTGSESTNLSTLPKGFSTLQVVTSGGPSGRYIAHVHISDHMGHFVKSWNQDFGFGGELKNVNRRVSSGVRSFLVWDGRDSKGQSVGQGVYVWSVIFDTPNGKETLVKRTGLVR